LIDRRYLFVGSLNIDPRSIRINAEMGLLIDSEAMVGGITSRVSERLPELAWRVVINENGQLEWYGHINGEEVIETKEPLTDSWLRFKAWFLKIAPESQL
ncbi:MAG: phospholipase D family protein, partial [Gammaproteobacteria bacterium]|nr:phospholipase D family protein [Gammaproteobacteria bacterium]